MITLGNQNLLLTIVLSQLASKFTHTTSSTWGNYGSILLYSLYTSIPYFLSSFNHYVLTHTLKPRSVPILKTKHLHLVYVHHSTPIITSLVYTYTHMSTHIILYTHIQTCTHRVPHACAHTHTHTHSHTCTNTHTHACTHTAYTDGQTQTQTCTRMHTHTHTHTQTHTHTHTSKHPTDDIIKGTAHLRVWLFRYKCSSG